MSDTPTPPSSGSGGTVLPRRSPGHRGQDQRDTVAEMIQKAHEISLEAGSKMATAMKDVIFAAAGLTPFAVESAKDLINYMVRRGQMSAEEAERIMREVESAGDKRGAARATARPALPAEPAPSFVPTYATSMPGSRAAAAPARIPTKSAPKTALRSAAGPPGKAAAKAKTPAKSAEKEPATRKPAAKAKKK